MTSQIDQTRFKNLCQKVESSGTSVAMVVKFINLFNLLIKGGADRNTLI